jgi:hypothetical protein
MNFRAMEMPVTLKPACFLGKVEDFRFCIPRASGSPVGYKNSFALSRRTNYIEPQRLKVCLESTSFAA